MDFPRILVVEDDKAFAVLIRHMLREGYAVVNAATFQQAREMLEHHGPFVATVLDLNLPDSRGLGTLYALLEHMEAHPDMPIFVLTGMDQVEEEIRSQGIPFLSKNVLDRDPGVLRTQIDGLLRGPHR